LRKLVLVVVGVLVAYSGVFASPKILAKVNGKPITEADLDGLIATLPPNFKALKNDPQFRKKLLENLIKEEILYQEALKEGIEKEEDVKREIERMKRRIIVGALIKRHVKPKVVKVTDSEVRAFYEKNKEKFKDANGKVVPLSMVKPFIVQNLQRQKEQKAFEDAFKSYLNSLEEKSRVEVYYK